MEGKTIVKVLELGDGYVLMKMDDNTYISAKVIDPEIAGEEIDELVEGEKPAAKKEEKKEEKKPAAKAEPVEDDELTWDEISEMGLKALKKVIEDKSLITDADDFEDDLPGLKKSIAKELDIEVPGKKPAPKEEPEEKKKEEDSSDYTWADLVAMDFEELSDLCKENKADTDPDDYDDDTEDAFRRAIAKEFDIEAPPKKKK